MAMSNAWSFSEYRDFEKEKKRVDGNMNESRPIDFIAVPPSPRYYFADQIVTIRDRADFVKRLTDDSYSNRVAFIHEPSFVPAPGIVHAWKETANTAMIDVESEGKAFLIMSVTPHKYWKISIDGRRADAIVTNIGYQGVVVPAGRHRIEMRYRNEVVPPAVTTSIASSILLLGAALLPRRRRDRR